MGIDFSRERWEEIGENSRLWWAGELDRPLLQFTWPGRDPGRPEPGIPPCGFIPFYDPAISAEAIVDRWDYDLSRLEFHGDGFPSVWPNFGPGVIAAFLGSELKAGSDTVWFHPKEQKEIADLRFEYDPGNFWLNRVKDVYRAAMDRWQGTVQVGMTDLGGNLDVLSTFRPSEKLLYDLYDSPKDVKRLTWEAHEMWWKYFEELDSLLRPANPGYTAWTPMLSAVPYYILQCDFAYMIGPDAFDEFVKPELAASCRRLGNAFYHLDGVGQLPHLDSLLTISELAGVQWVPGAGSPDCDKWPDVYRKIRDAGKLIQIWGDVRMLDTIAGQLGTARGIQLLGYASTRDEIIRAIEKYKA